MIERYADNLWKSTIESVQRLVAVAGSESTVLLDTVVLDVGKGFFVLTYSQTGLSCEFFESLTDLRWSGDSGLRIGQSSIDEWLELRSISAAERVPELPLRVQRMTGLFGVGEYEDVFSLELSGGSDTLVLMTTDSFDLVCGNLEAALARAEKVARNMGLNLTRESLPEGGTW